MKGDDLFEKSSMTFGEHLEELRVALVKASIWLAAGMLIGIPMASRVVTYMQVPLERSLENFYKKKSLAEMEASTGTKVEPSLIDWMEKNKVVSQMVWIDSRRLALPNAPEATGPEATGPEATGPEATGPEATGAATTGAATTGAATTGTDASSSEDKSAEETAATRDTAKITLLQDADHDGLPTPSQLIKMRMFVGVKAGTEALGLQEPFMIWLKAAFVVAIVVASPGIFYHLWQFVSAGLYPHERRYVYFFLPTSLILFWSGAFLAFFVIFQLVIDFLLDFNASMGIGASPRLTDYMSFALFLPLGFGIAFQLPLVMLVLERLGIISVTTYLSQWRIAVLAIAFISMILTPADIASFIGMTVPLVALYFLGIAMCHYLPRSSMQSNSARDPR